ncbi:Calmodulin-binding protein 25 [Bienertia sinuspersici]
MGDIDSDNSGSVPSSSTGGGVSDDGAESISALFNPTSIFNNNNNNNNMNSPLQLYSFSNNDNNNNNGSSSFDANHQLSNYFDHPPTLSHPSNNFMLTHSHYQNQNHSHNHNNNNNINQLEMVWPNEFRPRPSISTHNNHVNDATNYTITNHHQQASPPSSSAPPPPATITSSSGPSLGPTGSARNPKKRSRASRRAPTTVLTTDTNNFRQMVQEFTGVPAPPFTTRTQFNLFNTGFAFNPGSSTPPPYLLRPFPQKIPPLQQPPFLANFNNSSSSANINTSVSSSTPFNLCDQHIINTNPNLATLLSQPPPSLSPPPVNYSGICANTTAPDSSVNDNIRGSSSKGEGMVDSWICSSSD